MTKSKLNRIRSQVRRLHGIRDMRISQVQSSNDLESYYTAEDNLDEILDQLYSHTIFYIKDNDPDLYKAYIGMTKGNVKAKLLRQITNKKQNQESYRLNIDRLSDLKIKLTKTKSIEKRKSIKKDINRLERWAKDLNYEQKGKETRYKEG